jgi:hypothetical protein
MLSNSNSERRCARTMPANTIEPKKRLRSSAPYSSKIIKAGALIGDTKTLLSHWDVDASVDKNINRMQRDVIITSRIENKEAKDRVGPILWRIPARVVGVGFRPEHVKDR